MTRRLAIAVCVLAAAGSYVAARSTSGASAPAQALRTCVDRWNQANMVGWGPTVVDIAVRTLDAREQDQLGMRGPVRPQCAVSLAVAFGRDSTSGCSSGVVMPGHPKVCVDGRTTQICIINALGAYDCSRIADGGSPLRHANGTTDARGVLTLDHPPAGTHPALRLAWQHDPHVDGYITPWTRAKTIRPGLTLVHGTPARRYRGTCSAGSEYLRDRSVSALRCFSDVQLDPCFASGADWNRAGVVVACGATGSRTFWRFVVSHHA